MVSPRKTINTQHTKNKKTARKDLYNTFKQQMGKQDIEPLEIIENHTKQEEKTTISYQNTFEPQIRRMIDTIHELTYHTGKILEQDGDLQDLETTEWYLNQAQQINTKQTVQSIPQITVSQTLNRTIREIPSLEELAEQIPEIDQPQNYTDYTRHDL